MVKPSIDYSLQAERNPKLIKSEFLVGIHTLLSSLRHVPWCWHAFTCSNICDTTGEMFLGSCAMACAICRAVKGFESRYNFVASLFNCS